jgi:tetratricopeptide (TPR) repeat protein
MFNKGLLKAATWLAVCCLIFAAQGTSHLSLLGGQMASPAFASPVSTNSSGLMASGFNFLANYQSDRAISHFCPLVPYFAQDLTDPSKKAKCAQTLALIGRALQFDDNWAAAEQAYSLAHMLNPKQKTITGLLANSLSRLRLTAESQKLLADLSPQTASNMDVAIALAANHSRISDEAGAAAIIRRALATADDGVSKSIGSAFLARYLARQGLTAQAANYYRLAADATPNPYLQKLYLARYQSLSGKSDDAKRAFEAAGKILPDDASWQIGLTDISVGCISCDSILKQRIATVGTGRFSSTAYMRLANELNSHQRLDEAIKCCNHVAFIQPWSWEPSLYKGCLYRENNNNQAAERELQGCLKINPLSELAYSELEQVYQATGRHELADAIVKRGLEACPYSVTLWSALGQHRASQGKWSEALKAYEKAKSLMPADGDALNFVAQSTLATIYAGIGTCHYYLNEEKLAVEAAKQFNKYKYVYKKPGLLSLVPIRPDHVDFKTQAWSSVLKHELLADMLFETDHLQDCANEYRLALAGDPDNIELHSFLFVALKQANDWAAAVSEDFALSSKLVARLPSKCGEMAKQALSK